ncbi:hypothetical protein CPC16_009404 [Podila verticillata]|nr:hypothetical protein CPC16_009404 [Podila verticillata]
MSTASDGGFLEEDGHYGDHHDIQYNDHHNQYAVHQDRYDDRRDNRFEDHRNNRNDDNQYGSDGEEYYKDYKEKYKRARQRYKDLEDKRWRDREKAKEREEKLNAALNALSQENSKNAGKVAYAEMRLQEKTIEPLTREQQQKQRDDYDMFDRIIRFLEDSLRFVAGVHEPPAGATIGSRLQTIINSMVANEQRHAEIRAENEMLKADGRGDRSDRPSKPVEETLTRIMQESEKELTTLRLENTTLQSSHANLQEQLIAIMHEKKAMELELSEAKINADNLNKELNKSEKGRRTAQTVKEAKEKELVSIEARFESLDKHYREKEKLVTKLQRDNDRLQKGNDNRKTDYSRVKSESLTLDLEKISALETSLQQKDRQLEEQQQQLQDRDESLRAMAAKCMRLEDDEDRGLESFGKFRQDLAQVTMALTDNEVNAKKLEAALVVAHLDLEALAGKAVKDRQMVQHELAVSQKLVQDREKENMFLKRSIEQADLSAQDYRKHAEEDAAMIRDLETTVHELKAEIMEQQNTTVQLRQHLQAHVEDLAEQKKLTGARAEEVKTLRESIKKMGGDITDKEMETKYLALEELQIQVKTLNQQLGRHSRAPSHQTESGDLLDGKFDLGCIRNIHWLYDGIHRTTNDLIDALGSVVSLRQEVSEAMAGHHQDRDEILEKFHRAESELQAATASLKAEKEERAQELKEKEAMKMQSLASVVAAMEEEAAAMILTRDEMDERNSQLKASLKLAEDMIERLEKEIERRKKDMEDMAPELAGARSKIQEQNGVIQLLGEMVQDLKKTISRLQQENTEQAAVVEGREKALSRLDEARKMYDKVFESKVARLKEDKQIWEKRVEAEWVRVRAIHEQELKSLMENCTSTIEASQWNLATQRNTFEKERSILTQELEEARKIAESLEIKVEKQHADIVDRNVLIAGYMEFVTTQAEGGMVSENRGPWPAILEKQHTDIVKIEELEQKIIHITATLEGQTEILQTYEKNMADFTDKHQSYLKRMRDLEVELSEEKRQRAHEQENYALLLETVASMQNLGSDLMSRMERQTEDDSGILAQAQAQGGSGIGGGGS